MSVTLKNTAGRLQTILLDHNSEPRHAHLYQQSVLDPKSGSFATRRVALSVPRSLTLCAGETHPGLPDVVAMCPDVERLRKAGKIMVTRISEPAPTQVAAPMHDEPDEPATETVAAEGSTSAQQLQPEQNQSSRRTPPATRKRKG